ncbi:MAG: hypothetical protein IBX68_04620 [Dehalococcoidia bacterium]|nr:hypothetical protein [Dehalococcoidia bacterium]
MGAEGVRAQNMVPVHRSRPAAGQAVLFVIPSMVITIVSIVLFAALNRFTDQELNMFSVAVLLAVILSLVGTAGMQLLLYKLIDDRTLSREASALRGIRLGVIYSLLFSIAVSAALYPVFRDFLSFSPTYSIYFGVLLTLYSMTWIFTAAFWATERYTYPAVIFGLGYLWVFVLTFGVHQLSAQATLGGYTLGVAVLLVFAFAGSRLAFGRTRARYTLGQDLDAAGRIIPRNLAAISFQVFYILAIFLDKIIIWALTGLNTFQGLVVLGPYTTGAFLGLIPAFSIAAVAYFDVKTRSIAERLYDGTLSDIRQRIRLYKLAYRKGLALLFLVGLLLFAVVATTALIVFPGEQLLLRVLITTSLGALFLVVIVYNANVLALFGRTGTSATSAFVVCAGICLAIPFVALDPWYASIGFLAGSFLGFLISRSATSRLLAQFEYRLFRLLVAK